MRLFFKILGAAVIAAWFAFLILLLFVLPLVGLAKKAGAQQERDWSLSRVRIGPTFAAVRSDREPILSLPSGYHLWLWGIIPQQGYRAVLTAALEERITCVLHDEKQRHDEFPEVVCRTPKIPDLAAMLVKRNVAIPDVRSPRR